MFFLCFLVEKIIHKQKPGYTNKTKINFKFKFFANYAKSIRNKINE